MPSTIEPHKTKATPTTQAPSGGYINKQGVCKKEEGSTKDPIDGSKRNQQTTQRERRWQMVPYAPPSPCCKPFICLGIPYVPRSHKTPLGSHMSKLCPRIPYVLGS
ncbi:hypothetical protein KP509_1Z001100 [Ceratopteris richardii]|nr:hypothetical protein KP509_1Z001100 [Ceratopteris richardii]